MTDRAAHRADHGFLAMKNAYRHPVVILRKGGAEICRSQGILQLLAVDEFHAADGTSKIAQNMAASVDEPGEGRGGLLGQKISLGMLRFSNKRDFHRCDDAEVALGEKSIDVRTKPPLVNAVRRRSGDFRPGRLINF